MNNNYPMKDGKILLIKKEKMNIDEYIKNNITHVIDVLIEVFSDEYPFMQIVKPYIIDNDINETCTTFNKDQIELIKKYRSNKMYMAFISGFDIYLFIDRMILNAMVSKKLNVDEYGDAFDYHDKSIVQIFIKYIANSYYHELFHMLEYLTSSMTVNNKRDRVINVFGRHVGSENYAESSAINMVNRYLKKIYRKLNLI